MKILSCLLLMLLCLSISTQCYAEKPKPAAEAYLFESAIKLKRLASRSDTDNLRLSISTSIIIEGAAIWDANGELIFPNPRGMTHVNDDKVIAQLPRLRNLLKLAKPTVWEQRGRAGSHLLYCSADAISACMVVSTQALSKALGIDPAQLLNALFHQKNNSIVAYFVLLSLLIAGLFYMDRFKRKRKEALPEEVTTEFEFGDLIISSSKLTAIRGDTDITLSRRDVSLLAHLVKNPNEAISKEALYQAGWGRTFMPSSRALDQHVLMLRRKIDLDRNHPSLIQTVHGVGYRYRLA